MLRLNRTTCMVIQAGWSYPVSKEGREVPASRPWDDYSYALAYRSYGRKHANAAAYDVALARARSALDKTPAGRDGSWLKEWIEETLAESKDPNFGWQPGARYLDDIDPP